MKDYILRIIAAAILCAFVKGFTDRHTAINSIIKSLCGIFLTLTILSPLVSFKFSSVANYINMYSSDADAAVEVGTSLTNASLYGSIKTQTESYILDKAGELGMEITVELMLDDQQPIPSSVIITGAISPYAKSTMTQILTKELGIPIEGQIWK